jgi:hypothetical protein
MASSSPSSPIKRISITPSASILRLIMHHPLPLSGFYRSDYMRIAKSAILRFWRHLSVTALAVTIGCSGAGEPSGPVPYPALSGAFDFTLTYSFSDGGGVGTITFVQPDPTQSALLMFGEIDLGVAKTSDLNSASIDHTRTVRFNLGSSSWRFEGTLSADARSINGEHFVTQGGGTFREGTWLATKR